MLVARGPAALDVDRLDVDRLDSTDLDAVGRGR